MFLMPTTLESWPLTISQVMIWYLNPLFVISGTKQMPKEEAVKLPYNSFFLINQRVGPKEEVVYFSDSFTGQLRNLPFSAILLYFVAKLM